MDKFQRWQHLRFQRSWKSFENNRPMGAGRDDILPANVSNGLPLTADNTLANVTLIASQ